MAHMNMQMNGTYEYANEWHMVFG